MHQSPTFSEYLRHVSLLADAWVHRGNNHVLEKSLVFPFLLKGLGPVAPLANLGEVESVVLNSAGDNEIIRKRVQDAIYSLDCVPLQMKCRPLILTTNYWDPMSTAGADVVGKWQHRVQLSLNPRDAGIIKKETHLKKMLAGLVFTSLLTSTLEEKNIYAFSQLVRQKSYYHDCFMLTCTPETAGEQRPNGFGVGDQYHRNSKTWNTAIEAIEKLQRLSEDDLCRLLSHAISESQHAEAPVMAKEIGQALTEVAASISKDDLLSADCLFKMKSALTYSFGMNSLADADVTATVLCNDLLFEQSGSKCFYCFPFSLGRDCCTLTVYAETKMWSDEQLLFDGLSHAMFPRPMLQDLSDVHYQLRAAKRIQAVINREPPPREKHLELKVHYEPAMELCGDFYFYGRGRRSHHWVIIGDAEGKGAGAALLAVKIVTLCQSLVPFFASPAALLQEINDILTADAKAVPDVGGNLGNTATACALLFDRHHHTVRIASAGHHLPILHNEDGCVKVTVDSRLPLGVEDDKVVRTGTGDKTLKLAEVQHPFMVGDTILLYTDGLLDAQNADHKAREVKISDLVKIMTNSKTDLKTLVGEVVDFARGDLEHFPDDVTVFAVRRVIDEAELKRP